MAKKKYSSINKDPEKLNYILNNRIKIYPISESEYFNRTGKGSHNANSKNWYIEVNDNGKFKIFTKSIIVSEIQDAIWKTIDYYYKLLNEKK